MVYIFDDPFATLFIISVVFYTFMKWKYAYWRRRHVPFLNPRMFFGNLENPFRRKTATGVEIKMFYDQFKSKGVKHGGIYSFSTPVYIPIDLEYVKNILSKDFQYFVERGRYYNEKDDPLSAHLFNIGGTKWKNLRAKLTPTFTSGKMKMMFFGLLECAETLNNAVDFCCVQKQSIEIKDFANKFTSDVIGSCVLGIKCNSFTRSDSEFPKYGNMLLKASPMEAARLAFAFSFPEFSKFLGLRRFNKKASDFFLNVVKDAIEYRESNNVISSDFLQILIDLKNNVDVDKTNLNAYKENSNNLTIEEIAAQVVVFFVGGFDTSAATISFALYELALNNEIQQKARDEVNQIMEKYQGKLTYEGIVEMKYLQQIFDETLRKYPPLPILNRQCIDTYKIPDSDVVLEKGTPVIISLLGLQNDPEYYPDPEKFDPDRFLSSERKPYPYLPFGDGPRACIGLRFGIMQTKVGLAMLLKNYRFALDPKTSVPLEMDLSFMCCPKGGIWLDATKINAVTCK